MTTTHPALLLAAFGVMVPFGGAAAFAPKTSVTLPSSLSSQRASTFTNPSKPSPPTRHANHRQKSRLLSSRVAFTGEKMLDGISAFDPLGCGHGWDDPLTGHHGCLSDTSSSMSSPTSTLPLSKFDTSASFLGLSSLIIAPYESHAATPISEGDFDPNSFRPVCGASDSFYRLLQGSTRAVVGDEGFSEYGPLIAGGLLRIRLELCVVESFFNEAVGPFIQQNGLSWILPFHETVETFLAGTIFALATTFILVGSTKLIQIITFYGDTLVGGPCRLIGGFFFDRACGKPVTLDVSLFGFFKTRLIGPQEEELKQSSGENELINFEMVEPTAIPILVLSGAVKIVGGASKIIRQFVEALDLFVGRYLVLIASSYIILKFVHFKIFPDFP